MAHSASSKHRSHTHTHGHQGESYVLYLDANGGFPDGHEKQFVVHAKDKVSIILDSFRLQETSPILVTNFPSACKGKGQFVHPVAPVINEESSMTITESDLFKKYTVFRGFFNAEGSWEIDLQIEDFDGSLQMQVLFLQNDISYSSKEPLIIKSYGRPEWFMVQPRITILGKPIGMDQLIIQTVLPYSLGNVADWADLLSEQIEIGYNGFHFPPIQQLGSSKSYYSIKDHLQPNPEIFNQDTSFNNQLVSDSSLSMVSNDNNSKESPPSSNIHSPKLLNKKDNSSPQGIHHSPAARHIKNKESRRSHSAIATCEMGEYEQGHHKITGAQEIQLNINEDKIKEEEEHHNRENKHQQIKEDRLRELQDMSPAKPIFQSSQNNNNNRLNASPRKTREQMKISNPFWEIKHIVHKLEKNGALSFVDILLNHTSYDSEWILDMPYAVYNPSNTPQLTSALELDEAIQHFSDAIANGCEEDYPNNIINNEEDLEKILNLLENKVFKKLKLEEYFLFDTDAYVQQFKATLTEKQLPIILQEIDVDDDENIFAKSGFTILFDFIKENAANIGYQRYGAQLDINKLCEKEISKSPRQFSIEAFKRAITHQNSLQKERVDGYIKEALESTRKQIRHYHIVLNNKEVSDICPLVPRYFTRMANGVYAANNGWILDYDPLKNFAEDNEFHYLRRDIFIWGDLIKLRFGQSKTDAPGLWKRMKKYVQEMAKVFHGFRLDNAHSTPLVVGEYLMRCARNVNKNLLVFAELFTGDGEKDALFSKRLGLNALVRELKNNSTTHQLFASLNVHSRASEITAGTLKHFYQTDITDRTQKKILTPHITKSIAYDQSHDNEATIKAFSHKYPLSLIALSSFSHFIQGTVYGFDELYPERLSVVNERRKYRMNFDCEVVERDEKLIDIGILLTIDKSTESIEIRGTWDDWKSGIKMNHFEGTHDLGKFTYLGIVKVSAQTRSIEYKFVIDGVWTADEKKPTKNGNNYVTLFENSGMFRSSTNLREARKRFIEINQILNKEYPFIFSETYPQGFISIMRETPKKDSFFFLITRTALESKSSTDSKLLMDIQCPGIISSIEGIFLTHDNLETREESSDGEYITGKKSLITEEFNIHKYAEIKYLEESKKHVLSFFNAPPSLSIILKCALHHSQKQGIQNLNQMIAHIQSDEVLALYQPLNVNDVNYLFFSCETEEQERSGYGMYSIPNKGPLNFAGFGGVFKEVNDASLKNDLSRPLFQNLRDGDWYLDYAVGRLKKAGGNLQKITEYIEQYFNLLKTIPRYLVPHYFCQFIMNIQQHAHFAIYSKFKSENTMRLTSEFHKSLFLANYQFLASIPSTKFESYEISMAAGLPHFAAGWARSWGRDTFIAFRGTLLIPGLYSEALSIICMFASTLRHGLIPNLLNNGANPRYNSRDACWWFIKAIKDYINFTNNSEILQKQIKMRFLSDDMLEHQELLSAGTEKYMKIHEIVYQILASHAKGIQFREWKAGWDIDTNMDTEGFNISLKLDEQTGFIVGGNLHNCLTWMDKMGSSVKAGNKGIPATCRDGAPIEMTAILKLCVDFAANCSAFPVKEVVTSSGKKLSFRSWSQQIMQYFERSYWIPNRLPSMDNMSERILQYITRKGIYKDLYKSSHPRCEFQLRPNAQIAIALAPELFSPQNALLHLATVECMLMEKNSIGIKTLDKIAKEYVPYYDNRDDGIQPRTAHGFSYHNGPEWVWVYGYYLKALLEMNKIIPIFTKDKLMSYLSNQKQFIKESEWLSLPEMTNQNSQYNQFACQSQAWSIAPIVEICFDSSNLAVKVVKN